MMNDKPFSASKMDEVNDLLDDFFAKLTDLLGADDIDEKYCVPMWRDVNDFMENKNTEAEQLDREAERDRARGLDYYGNPDSYYM